MEIETYLRLTYLAAGRTRPAVDCWGLYRLIVGEALGIWLGEFSGLEAPRDIARATRRESNGGDWLPIAPGKERFGDAVLMSGLLGEGRGTIRAPIHVGCVLEPARMIDIEESTGVQLRAFRSTTRMRARPEVANRVVGLFRPRELVEVVA